MNQPFSDEYLNAYLDNELDAEDKRRLLSALREDESLRARLCQLEQVRKMVSLAYSDVNLTNDGTQKGRRVFGGPMRAAIAASVLLVMGILIGWVAHVPATSNEPSLLSLADQVRLQPQRNDNAWKVLLHVTSDDPYRINVMLDETERLLKEYKSDPRDLDIEILANGKGLNMLRSDTSKFKGRIEQLQKHYSNLAFYACGKAIERLKKEQGIDVQLLPNVNRARSALSRSMKRQKEGWTYIKI
jgi:intracellular sulfur oxidation DsrE/DsrF family protein